MSQDETRACEVSATNCLIYGTSLLPAYVNAKYLHALKIDDVQSEQKHLMLLKVWRKGKKQDGQAHGLVDVQAAKRMKCHTDEQLRRWDLEDVHRQ